MRKLRWLAPLLCAVALVFGIAPMAFADDTADKTQLQEAVDAAGQLKESDYYPATWKLVADQLEVANGLLEDAEATQEDVDAAATLLTDLMKVGAGGYLVEKSTVSNPPANGTYKADFVAYNASGYGTDTRALGTFPLSSQFDPDIILTKDGDQLTLKLVYASTIDMQAVFLNDDEDSSTKTATGEKREITPPWGNRAC